MKKSPMILVASLAAFFTVVFLLIVGISLWGLCSTQGGTQKKFFAKGTKIGVLELTGVILESKKVIERIDLLEEDTNVKGVIIRLNSPGGAVAPSQEIYDAVKRLGLKKPVYASMGSLAASGAYYVACATHKIFADAGTITGSIGVIMQFMDLSKLYQWAKVNPYHIKTGKFKDIGSPEREMTGEERALLQGMIDNVLMQFRQAVVQGRKMSLDRVIELSDGRIFSGEQAKAVHLVDELGGLRETADAMMVALKGEGKVNLFYPKKKKKAFMDYIMDDDDDYSSSESSEPSEASVLGGVRVLTRFLRALSLLDASVIDASAKDAPRAFVGANPPHWGPMYLLPVRM